MRAWLVAAALLAALLAAPTAAQTYPNRPVRILVPAQPGGGLDLIGRTIAESLGRAFGQSFVVENSSGGGGAIASQTVARAAPDGHTLMVGYVATHATNPAVRKVPYDPLRDFTPVAMVGGTRNLLVVRPTVPVEDMVSFVAHAKGLAGKLIYGSGGIGTLNHLVMEQFKGAAGIETVTAHYRGIGPAFQDMMSGQIEVMTPGLAAAMPYIRTQRVRPIAVTGLARHPLIPNVPTFEEAGYKDFDGVQWYGIVGPAGMGAEVTGRLHGEITRALAQPALQARLANEAIDPMPMTPAQFAAFIQAELARYRELARARKLSLDD